MSTDNKISALIESQFPEFTLEEGPKLVAFIKAYYEWMEQTGNVLYEAKKLPENLDLDTTSDTYLEYFKREIFASIPDDVLVDKRFLAKHIRELYRSKGTEQSYRFLFRALFDEEIDVYYPAEYILKTSDGRWSVPKTIRLTSLQSTNSSLFDGKIVTGQTSGAKARVNGIDFTEEFGVQVTELFLKNIVGSFEDGERVINEDSTNSGILFNDTGVLQNVIVTNGGVGHITGDLVNLTSVGGSGANGVIEATTDLSAIEFSITDGGSGYTVDSDISVIGFGQGATFTIDSISNTEILSLNEDIISPFSNVVIGTGPTFVSLGANTSAVNSNLAAANSGSTIASALTFSNVTVGTINSITTTNKGFGYASLPVITVVESEVAGQEISDGSGGFKGENAVIRASHVPGAITQVSINNAGSTYSKFVPVTIVNTSRVGTVNAIASPIISGQVTYSGKYTDTKGFLSWDQKLQDGDFYQEYSYVIRSTQSIKDYKEITKKLIHPAGTKQFGEYKIISSLNLGSTISLDSLGMTIESLSTISIPSIIGTVDSQYAPEGITQVYETENEIILSPGVTSVESETIQYLPMTTGSINIQTASLIGEFANTLISVLANTVISTFGDSGDVVGTGTTFGTFYRPQRIFIVDNDGVYANGFYTIETVANNTSLSIIPNYEHDSLANGTIYFADPVYELDWGSVSANATIVIDYGSVTVAANNFTAYGIL